MTTGIVLSLVFLSVLTVIAFTISIYLLSTRHSEDVKPQPTKSPVPYPPSPSPIPPSSTNGGFVYTATASSSDNTFTFQPNQSFCDPESSGTLEVVTRTFGSINQVYLDGKGQIRIPSTGMYRFTLTIRAHDDDDGAVHLNGICPYRNGRPMIVNQDSFEVLFLPTDGARRRNATFVYTYFLVEGDFFSFAPLCIIQSSNDLECAKTQGEIYTINVGYLQLVMEHLSST